MNGSVNVDIDQLERITTRLVAAIRDSNGRDVPLTEDYFWSIPLDRLMDVASMPPELGIGQVSECLEWLESLEANASTALPYHLAALGNVLVALGVSLAADFSVRQLPEEER